MTPREQAKERNREKIRRAAEKIIREEGIEKLTMRYLAEAASVSLRTPYNLFGSKTELLIALLDPAREAFSTSSGDDVSPSPIERLFEMLSGAGRLFGGDEPYYRDVYWAIMTSDQPETRLEGYRTVIVLTQSLTAQALAAKELKAETNADALGEHLAIILMAVVGMWAGGLFGAEACLNQVRESWSARLEAAATAKGRLAIPLRPGR